jgi:hypothetical protein
MKIGIEFKRLAKISGIVWLIVLDKIDKEPEYSMYFVNETHVNKQPIPIKNWLYANGMYGLNK